MKLQQAMGSRYRQWWHLGRGACCWMLGNHAEDGRLPSFHNWKTGHGKKGFWLRKCMALDKAEKLSKFHMVDTCGWNPHLVPHGCLQCKQQHPCYEVDHTSQMINKVTRCLESMILSGQTGLELLLKTCLCQGHSCHETNSLKQIH